MQTSTFHRPAPRVLKTILIAAIALTATSVWATDIAPAESTNPAELPNVTPSKVENADSAFAKLDIGKKGYITPGDTKVLSGFDPVFKANDNNHDGKLTPDEFMSGWAAYTGIPSKPENFQRGK